MQKRKSYLPTKIPYRAVPENPGQGDNKNEDGNSENVKEDSTCETEPAQPPQGRRLCRCNCCDHGELLPLPIATSESSSNEAPPPAIMYDVLGSIREEEEVSLEMEILDLDILDMEAASVLSETSSGSYNEDIDLTPLYPPFTNSQLMGPPERDLDDTVSIDDIMVFGDNESITPSPPPKCQLPNKKTEKADEDKQDKPNENMAKEKRKQGKIRQKKKSSDICDPKTPPASPSPPKKRKLETPKSSGSAKKSTKSARKTKNLNKILNWKDAPEDVKEIGRSSDGDEDEYVVELLIDSYFKGEDGERSFFVKWQDWPDSWNQWILEKDIDQAVGGLLWEWKKSEQERIFAANSIVFEYLDIKQQLISQKLKCPK